LDCYSLFKRS